jgi:hypothetical protein
VVIGWLDIVGNKSSIIATTILISKPEEGKQSEPEIMN